VAGGYTLGEDMMDLERAAAALVAEVLAPGAG
jgi:hypothetical protein